MPAAGFIVRAKYRMRGHFQELRGALAVAALLCAQVVAVESAFSLERVSQVGGQCFVGAIAVGEQRVAAARGHLQGIQAGALVREIDVQHVVVKPHVAIGQQADRLAVLADIADQHDALEQLRHAGWAHLGRARQFREFAEIAGRAQELLLVQILPAKHEYQAIKPRGIDGFPRALVKGLGQINAANLGADMSGKRDDFHLPVLLLAGRLLFARSTPARPRDGFTVGKWIPIFYYPVEMYCKRAVGVICARRSILVARQQPPKGVELTPLRSIPVRRRRRGLASTP